MMFNRKKPASPLDARMRAGEVALTRDRPGASRLGSGLSEAEQEWKQAILKRVIKMMDLSLLATLDESTAREQIRETCEGLMAEESRPINLPTRQWAR